MTNSSGSIIVEERTKLEKEIEETIKEVSELKSELRLELQRKRIEEKGLCERGEQTCKEEDLEWDLYMTEGKLRFKREKLKEYLEENILYTRIKQVKEELIWCRALIRESLSEIAELKVLAKKEAGKEVQVSEENTAKYKIARCEVGKEETNKRIAELQDKLVRLEEEREHLTTNQEDSSEGYSQNSKKQRTEN